MTCSNARENAVVQSACPTAGIAGASRCSLQRHSWSSWQSASAFGTVRGLLFKERRIAVAFRGALSWSPDGRKIAFVRIHGGLADIYVVNADGSGLRRLAGAIAFRPMGGGPSQTPGWNANPAWSPDGRRIAFVSNRAGNDDIFVVNADGSGLRQLTRNRRNDRDPVWSPDSRVIAFQGRREPPTELERAVCRGHCMRHEIYVVDADRGGLRRLTRNWKTDHPAAWSPDGRKLLFVRSGHGDVWVMNADGSGQRNLTRSLTQPLASDGAPAWWPDGRKILFNWFDVYVMNADGSGKRKLTQMKGQG